MQIAPPIGQNAIVPVSTVGLAFSSPLFTGISKYTSSFHNAALPSIGSLRTRVSTVLGARKRMNSPSASPRLSIRNLILIRETSSSAVTVTPSLSKNHLQVLRDRLVLVLEVHI